MSNLSHKLITLPKLAATAGTALQVTTAHQNASSISIAADEDNTGKIYVGDSNVTTDRYAEVLSAGEAWEWSEQDASGRGLVDASSVYIEASADTNHVQVGIT